MFVRTPLRTCLTFFTWALLAAGVAGAQTTWYVDDNAPGDPGPGDPTISDPLEDGSPEHPFDAIQEGIDSASDGDTVLVADGTYTGAGNKGIDYRGKPIAVRSENGAEHCVVDCEGERRAFRFHSGETAESVVEGLTIVNGSASYGGGVYCCYNSSPTITNCTISGNSATSYGGGVYCYESNPTITNCTISGNSASYGGGVYCYESNPTITNCTISGNSASRDGGGVHCRDSNPTLTNCTIRGNSAYDKGGGVYCRECTPTLTNCMIRGNSANDGGGVYCYYYNSDPTLTNCILWGDTPQEIHGSPVVTYCNVQGGWSGEGNIDDDPLFAFTDDFHLMAGTPCIDTGTNDPVGGLPSHDLDGNARPLDGDGDTVDVADMGVYEFNPAAPSIALSPTRLEFSAPEGGDDPPDRILSLRNCGGGVLQWEITGQPAWLTVSPSNDESTGEVDDVTLSVDISGLPYGAYTTVLEIADPQAVNSPRAAIVTLYVTGTLYVPGEYPTIQAAIDVAFPGDEIVVADGVYRGAGNKNLDFGGKVLTVRSASGNPALCIIDCEGDGRGFYFHSGEGPESIVEGLTITNGHNENYGGGVYCYGSSPTLTNCLISGNSANYDGGGVLCWSSSSPTLVNCTISENSANGGGGIYCRESSPALTNCTISGNSVTDDHAYGGGVFCWGSGNLTLTNCTISGNSVTGYGVRGGGIYWNDSSPALTNCTISGNSATGYSADGGGVFCWNSSNPTLTNCLISGNSATADGGGVFCAANNLTLANCTITGNSASDGGGLYCSGSSPTLTNCILWGDTPQEMRPYYSSSPVVTYSDVQGGWPGEGNIDVDPAFAFVDDPHLMPGSPCIDAGTNDPPGGLPPDDLDGNPRLLDGDGDSIATVDMGAFEFAPEFPAIACSPASLSSVAYVDGPLDEQIISIRNSGSGLLEWEIVEQCPWLQVSPSSGQSAGEIAEVVVSMDASELSTGIYAGTFDIVAPGAVNSPRTVHVMLRVWTGYPTIQSLIDAAEDGDIVVIPDGTYTGPDNRNLDFGGKAITVCSENGPDNCIIDCRYEGYGFHLHSGETSNAIVDGFTITNGDTGITCSNSSPMIVNCSITGCIGAGVRCGNGSPTIINCGISGNAYGGIRAWDDVTIAGCTISGNTAGWGGGIMCGQGSTWISDCTIAGNTASNFGAGVASEGGDVTITNCTISGNTCTASSVGGAGIVCLYGSAVITNCTISGNSSVSHGGGLYWYRNNPVISNCTITYNSAGEEGGGVACGFASAAILTNCIIWGNSAELGPQIAVIGGDSAELSVCYNNVAGGEEAAYVPGGTLIWGPGNIDADPLFVDPDGPDDDPNTFEDNDFRLAAGSPCIDAGDNTAVPADTGDLDGDGDTAERMPLDHDGRPRFVQDPYTDDTGVPDPPHYRWIVDMGAFELQFCFGDLDDDGEIGLSDLSELLGHYGATAGAAYEDGDLDGDHDVDLADLAELLGVYGNTCP